MRHEKFTTCTKCGAPLGKGNTSGHCRKCALGEAARQRRQANAEFAMLAQACQMASGEAVGRLWQFLSEERRKSDLVFAKHLGAPLSVRLPNGLTPCDIDRLWRGEQIRAELPPLAIEEGVGLIRLRFWNDIFRSHTPAEIRSRFESALRREYPDLPIEWVDG